MGAAEDLAPRRFRRRLTLTFILVGATIGALLAITSYLLIRDYREETFERHANEQAQLSLLAAPSEVSLTSFEALLNEYSERAGFETIAITDGVVYSSAPDFGREDLPARLAAPGRDPALRALNTMVDGVSYRVVAARADSTDLYFFFPRRSLLESLDRFREILSAAWLAAVAVAALSGYFVARYTLRPVRQAASAAHLLAERLLDTPPPAADADELGALGLSFQRLAVALEKKIADLRRAAERERRFTADIAHDLRTPLTALVSAAEVLEDEFDAVAPAAQRPARLMIDSARRLQHLVSDLLELARLDAGHDRASTELLPLRPVLTALADNGPEAGRVDVVVDGDLAVLADPIRLRRIMDNLIANAHSHGGGQVQIHARLDGPWVAIEVIDGGPGIAEEHLEHIFDRFYKLDGARSQGGSGLGLAIALENAKLQGGSLEAANMANGGACFTLRLPAAVAD